MKKWLVGIGAGFLALLLFPLGGMLFFGGPPPSIPASNSQCITTGGTLPLRVPQPYNSIITAASSLYNTEPVAVALALAVENRGYPDPPPPYGNGKPWPTSPAGAQGPMQIMPATMEQYKNSNPAHKPGNVNDLTDAVYAAAHLLADLGAMKGVPFGDKATPRTKPSIIYSLAAYNAGERGNFDNPETIQYLELATKEYEILQQSPASPSMIPVKSECILQPGPPITVGPIPDGYPNTADLVCPTGTADLGVSKTARGNVIRICSVRGIVVNASAAPNVLAMFQAASSAGFELSGSGFRSMNEQIALRKQHCGTSEYAIWKMPSRACTPDTAIPGRSQHEQGLALDLRVNGGKLRRDSSAWSWMSANAGKFGFINLLNGSEPWHWSTTGH